MRLASLRAPRPRSRRAAALRAAALLAPLPTLALAFAAPAAAQTPAGQKPSVVVSPTVAGELREGRVVGVLGGLWSGSQPTTFTNRWERCDAQRCVPTGETGFLKRVVPADVGMRLRALVTGTNASGTTAVYTAQSAVVKPLVRRYERLKPFPVVGIVGLSTRKGARLSRLSVSAPRGSTLLLTCQGRGCPYRSVRRRLDGGLFLAKKMVGRSLAVGTVIDVRVTAPGRVGKYTRFRIRRDMRPARVDRCLVPGQARPSRCTPASSQPAYLLSHRAR